MYCKIFHSSQVNSLEDLINDFLNNEPIPIVTDIKQSFENGYLVITIFYKFKGADNGK